MHNPEYGCPGYFYDIFTKHFKDGFKHLKKYADYFHQQLKYPTRSVVSTDAYYALQGYYYQEQATFYKTGKYSDHIKTAQQFEKLEQTFSAFVVDAIFSEMKSNTTDYDPVKLWTTRITQEIVTHILGHSGSDTHEPYIQIFQGSNHNILAMLLGLEYTDAQCILDNFPGNTQAGEHQKLCQGVPPPGSSITFEIYKHNNGEHSLEAKFNGKNINVCESSPCNVEEAIRKLQDNLIDEDLFNIKCNLFPDLRNSMENENKQLWLLKVVTIGSICASVFFIVCIVVDGVFRRRDYNKFYLYFTWWKFK
jgi:hypothetical protein